MSTLEDESRQADAEVAQRLSATVAADLLRVIDYYRHVEVEGPVFLRYVTLHAMLEVLGHLFQEAMEADAERARPWIAETLKHLALYVEPSARHTH